MGQKREKNARIFFALRVQIYPGRPFNPQVVLTIGGPYGTLGVLKVTNIQDYVGAIHFSCIFGPQKANKNFYNCKKYFIGLKRFHENRFW